MVTPFFLSINKSVGYNDSLTGIYALNLITLLGDKNSYNADVAYDEYYPTQVCIIFQAGIPSFLKSMKDACQSYPDYKRNSMKQNASS